MNAGVLDYLLAALLLSLGGLVVSTRNLFKAVVLFIVFGLLMALTWSVLSAPDVALAEAAVGAGLTGALLLDALGRMERRETGEPPSHAERDRDGTAT